MVNGINTRTTYSDLSNKCAAHLILIEKIHVLLDPQRLLISEKSAIHTNFHVKNSKNSHLHALINTSMFIHFAHFSYLHSIIEKNKIEEQLQKMKHWLFLHTH